MPRKRRNNLGRVADEELFSNSGDDIEPEPNTTENTLVPAVLKDPSQAKLLTPLPKAH